MSVNPYRIAVLHTDHRSIVDVNDNNDVSRDIGIQGKDHIAKSYHMNVTVKENNLKTVIRKLRFN